MEFDTPKLKRGIRVEIQTAAFVSVKVGLHR